eukprot:Hpha_TRINITY_DN34740_c0_g1::TRINITY_DN34740_c0_g1_i1::g.178081::m.178081/K10436/MAPRE; microtubule-associated protein, RP/EB family
MANGEFGMMDGAYFVSRSELIHWVNEFIGLNYSKVEQCCSGIAHIQIVDALFPGTVPLHKVNFSAKLEHEYINNLKVLQNAFSANGIKKVIEIERLVKGKYQDNLEFLQWIKRFADARMPQGLAYDAHAARENALQMQKRLQGRRGDGGKVPSARPRRPPQEPQDEGRPRASTPPVHAKVVFPANSEQRVEQPEGYGAVKRGGEERKQQQQRGTGDVQLLEELKAAQLTADTLEQERDFYYSKLREIEILCQNAETLSAEAVRQVLYATSENFEPPYQTQRTTAE